MLLVYHYLTEHEPSDELWQGGEVGSRMRSTNRKVSFSRVELHVRINSAPVAEGQSPSLTSVHRVIPYPATALVYQALVAVAVSC